MNSPEPNFEIPAESAILKTAYRKSGLTVADLAAATSLSVATVNNALNGIRYRDGKARAAAPPDATLVKLAFVLHIRPDELRARDRVRAADLLEQERGVNDAPLISAGTQSLAQRVLAAFSTDELQAEIERRERAEYSQEGIDDAAADLRADQAVQ